MSSIFPPFTAYNKTPRKVKFWELKWDRNDTSSPISRKSNLILLLFLCQMRYWTWKKALTYNMNQIFFFEKSYRKFKTFVLQKNFNHILLFLELYSTFFLISKKLSYFSQKILFYINYFSLGLHKYIRMQEKYLALLK